MLTFAMIEGSSEQIYVVLGYRCHLTEALRRYLDGAAERINNASDRPTTVITSGGFTNQRSAPGVSEARLMADYLTARGVVAEMILDEDARTTVENLRGVARIVRARAPKLRRLTILGDTIRRQKITMLARHFLGDQPFELCLFDLQRGAAQSAIQRWLGFGFDYVAARFRPVERAGLALIELRMRIT